MPVFELSLPSGHAPFSVSRVSAHEAISSLYRVFVWARSTDPNLDLEAILGQPASLRAVSGRAFARLDGVRRWSGIVSYAEQLHAEPTGLSTYQLQIVPSLWLLTQRSNHRVFQHLTVPAIVARLLSEWGIDAAWEIDPGAYPKLELRVQYGETDYAFLCRLLEEAGIAFTFPEDGASGGNVTFSDGLGQGSNQEGPRLLCASDDLRGALDRALLWRVRLSHEVRPGAVTLGDHDFMRVVPLFGESPKASPEERFEQFHYSPGAFLIEDGSASPGEISSARHDAATGSRRAEHALAGARVGRELVFFETNSVDLWPGVVFSMDAPPHAELEGKLLVLEHTLEGSAEGEWGMSGRALLVSSPYRPPLHTPKPEAIGVQSATIVGPGADEIHTDEYGRVRVEFPWDRGGRAAGYSSCWMRVSQGWGGSGYGMMALPRVGQEVLIAFEGGDPDQPVVVGRLYNQTQRVPHVLPEHDTVSGAKSASSPGQKGYNEIKLDDKKGHELFSIHAERNLRSLVKNDDTSTVLGSRTKIVAIEETETTGLLRTQVTLGFRTDVQGLTRVTAIGGSSNTRVKGSDRGRIAGSRQRSIGKDLSSIVRGSERESVDGDAHRQVLGDQREQVDGVESLVIEEDRHERVEGNHAMVAGKSVHLKAGQVMVAEASHDVTIGGPGGFLRIDATGVTIKGTLVRINTGASPGKGKGAKPSLPDAPHEAKVDDLPLLAEASAPGGR
ncbi:MAG: type VI secretion system tip protein TssI/VgrG [Minicystis sp.]